MTAYTATYSPDDNKCRLYASSRLDSETFARVKAAGFKWAPKQELFVAPMWTPGREDLLLELAGEIEDEDKSLCERAEERADRFDDYSAKRGKDADRAHKAVAAIADNIPFGQPILVGHHSERHARKDQERIESGMRRAVSMWKTSQYWKGRAAGALAAAKYKERPDVRARRIKGIESDARKEEKRKADALKALEVWQQIEAMDNAPEKQHAAALAFTGNTVIGSFRLLIDGEYRWSAWDVLLPEERRYKACPAWTVRQVIESARRLYPRIIADCDRWLEHYANRLAYERAMLGEQGGLIIDHHTIEPGGQVLVGSTWYPVVRINRGASGEIVSISVRQRGPSIGIEAVKDYRVATADMAAAVKAVTTVAPIANYPGEGFVHITQEAWNKAPKDYRGFTPVAATETVGRHRVRQIQGCFINPASLLPGYAEAKDNTARWSITHRYHSVFITDSKVVQPPAPTGEAPAKLPRPEPVLPPAPRATEPEKSADLSTEAEPEGPSFEQIADALKAGVQVVAIPQLFPTPANIARDMVRMADIHRSHRVLEPSAGLGAIWSEMADIGCKRTAIEINRLAADRLEAISGGCSTVLCADFLECEPGTIGKFDRILMNPPFKDGADIRHIAHALQFLADGGRLVAICANGPRQAAKLQPLAALWKPLPDGTFADQGTNVRTVLLTIEGVPESLHRKQAAAAEIATEEAPPVVVADVKPAPAVTAKAGGRVDLFSF